MNFNEKIQYILDREQWTQVDLSNKTGIHIKTINQWMKRKKAPNSQKLSMISKITDYNIEWLRNDNYQGPILEKGRWAFEADKKIKTFKEYEIKLIYSRLKEIKESRQLNTAQLLEISKLHIHATQDELYFLGYPPYGMAIEKISNATGYNKDWIITGIGPKYIDTNRISSLKKDYDPHGGWRPRLVGEDYEYAGKVLKILESKTVYSTALKSNIDAFYQALISEKTLTNEIEDLKQRITGLEDKKKEDF